LGGAGASVVGAPPGFTPGVKAGAGFMPSSFAGPGDALTVLTAQRSADALAVARSADDGATWTAPTSLAVNGLPYAPTALPLAGGALGIAYLLDLPPNFDDQALEFQRYPDPPVAIYPAAGAHAVLENAKAVALGDALGVALLECTTQNCGIPGTAERVLFVRSADQGRTWSAPVRVDTPSTGATTSDFTDFAVVANGARGELAIAWQATGKIFIATSADRGASFRAPVEVDANASDASPVLAADPKSGRYYAAWAVDIPNPQAGSSPFTGQVMIAHSDDGGARWSTPVMVAAGPMTDNHYEARMAVDAAGTVHLGWLDGTPLSLAVSVVYAASRDGGATWSSPVVVSNAITPEVPWTFDLLLTAQGTPSFVWANLPTDADNDEVMFSRANTPK
jgi:hypothetical protein